MSKLDKQALREKARERAAAAPHYCATRDPHDLKPETDVSNKPDRTGGAADAQRVPTVPFHTSVRNGGQFN